MRRGLVNFQTKGKSRFDVPKYPFDNNPMFLHRRVEILADFVNSER
jgi:hypothetical protein